MGVIRAFSYGGGVQSTAALVLAAQGRIDYRLFIFANVGDDSEHPATIEYVESHAKPYAEAHGIELVEVAYQRKDGKTLYGRTMMGRGHPIPVRGMNGKPMKRGCTHQWKVGAVEKELIRRGATPDEPAISGLGISMDEFERAAPGRVDAKSVQIRTYPLLVPTSLDPHSEGIGLTRTDCERVIRDGGLPVPPKSACWFCPFHDMDAWRHLRQETPELWDKAVEMEATFIERRTEAGQRPVFLTRFGRPLIQVVDDQQQIPGMDGCDAGHCFT